MKSGSYKNTVVINDDLSNYLFQVDAVNPNGALGSAVSTIATRDTFAISYALPKFMVVGDALKIPVTISNQGTVALRIQLFETLNDPSLKVVLPAVAANLAANAALSTFVTVTAVSEKVGASINIVANATAGTVTYSN